MTTSHSNDDQQMKRAATRVALTGRRAPHAAPAAMARASSTSWALRISGAALRDDDRVGLRGEPPSLGAGAVDTAHGARRVGAPAQRDARDLGGALGGELGEGHDPFEGSLDGARATRAALALVAIFAFGVLNALGSAGCTPPPDDAVVGDDDDDDGPPAAQPPALAAAEAQLAGAVGADLRIAVEGSDADGDAVAVELFITDGNEAEVPLFDEDFDGVPESGHLLLPFDGPPLALDAAAPVDAGGAFAAVATVQNALADAGGRALAHVSVRLIDAQGAASAELAIDIDEQPVRGANQPCDPAHVLDRCEDGFGCKGEPALCRGVEPPVIERAAYLLPALEGDGPRFIVEGTDPDGDVRALHLELFDADGVPVALDFDGDDIADSATFDVAVDAAAAALAAARPDGFLVQLEMGQGLEALVDRIVVTAEDRASLTSAPQTLDLGAAPTRGTGQSCSAEGFDSCIAGAVCSPGVVGQNNACQSAATVRASQCAQAARLVPVDGHAEMTGVADGASAWDAPSGCVPNDPVGRAESVVLLELAADAERVVVTTDVPATAFDTTLYLLADCALDGSAAMACIDDGDATVASTVELGPLPAGTYAIVVDSYLDGGAFGLAVDVE